MNYFVFYLKKIQLGTSAVYLYFLSFYGIVMVILDHSRSQSKETSARSLFYS